MLKRAVFASLLLLTVMIIQAQKAVIKGNVSDTAEKRNLHLAVVSLLKKTDTTLVAYTRTDAQGRFSLPSTDTGQYILLVSFPKFADYMESLSVQSDMQVGNINMTQKTKLLDEVVLRTGSAIRIKGDTTEFVADSFYTKAGATVEDLLKKLPGFTVNSKGEIVAQGKRVDKVLVDGEEFFGDDPTMATQNISAKAVDKVQIFETKTEQQQLTGITSGTEGKTVNIKLKEDAKRGYFGKMHAGTDFNKYYDTKALFNRFAGKKKFSIYGTRANTSTGSLNWDDRQKLGIENDMEYDELSGFYFSYGNQDEFNDWNLRGLPNSWTAGTLFSNKWKNDYQNVNLSYRYNRLGTTNVGTKLDQYILDTTVNYSNRYTTKNALNQQHVLSGKYEWKLDSLASLKLVTTNTYKTSQTDGTDNGEYLDGQLDTVNRSFKNYVSNTKRNQFDNQLTYKQLFKKKNRLWQTVLRFGITDDDNDGINDTYIRYYDNGVFLRDSTTDQMRLFTGKSTTYGLKTTFSEPLSDKWAMIVDYAYNNNHSSSHRNTFEKGLGDKYEVLVKAFSNNFEMDAFSHSGTTTFRYTGKKLRAAVGAGLSSVRLRLEDLDSSIFRKFNFLNFTPQASVNFTPKQQKNYSFNYRGTTRQPTIGQLQPLRDNTDVLNEYIGNPDLKVGFNHSFSVNFNEYKVLKQQYMYFYGNFNVTQNAITQYNTIDASGKRTYMPVNVNGNSNWNIGGNFNKGGGMFSGGGGEKGKVKANYGGGINGNGGKFINFVNGKRAVTRSFSMNFNLSFGLEAEEKFEISFSPSIGYNSSKSSLNPVDNNYFTYGGWIDGSVKLPWKLQLWTNTRFDLRQKIDAFADNTNLIVWNATLSKPVFKKDAGKISIVANDILDENKGFVRTINSTFVSDDRFQRISRYFLLKFEWSFTKAPGGETK